MNKIEMEPEMAPLRCLGIKRTPLCVLAQTCLRPSQQIQAQAVSPFTLIRMKGFGRLTSQYAVFLTFPGAGAAPILPVRI